ncbi:hypothetical protein BJF92_14910 [Rhizobium rhizosphaerae]|uniref:Uncharacterized protein n=1 Tax=Xaviernesmea rhizosphaerae TaxID=1672749 RepID=A0A1Q9ACQ4_9HYPH|nr:hypothetical protein [Xaviernesmea rhizosphaerae]OLP52693.1 hypothetical protein BJF92_14910 [Xaviernesmea rhizosphaerae]
MPPETRDPIIIADARPLIRLAAADLLEAIRLTNRQIVLVDRVEDEVCGDPSKPFASEVADWLSRMQDAVIRAPTLEGLAIATLRQQSAQGNAAAAERLKKALRHSGERAIREYVEMIEPSDVETALVLYEDGAVPNLMSAANVPMVLMTTRAFVREVIDRGYNGDALQALESTGYHLKPPIRTVIEGGFEESSL